MLITKLAFSTYHEIPDTAVLFSNQINCFFKMYKFLILEITFKISFLNIKNGTQIILRAIVYKEAKFRY